MENLNSKMFCFPVCIAGGMVEIVTFDKLNVIFFLQLS